jgi:hypothetical protein
MHDYVRGRGSSGVRRGELTWSNPLKSTDSSYRSSTGLLRPTEFRARALRARVSWVRAGTLLSHETVNIDTEEHRTTEDRGVAVASADDGHAQHFWPALDVLIFATLGTFAFALRSHAPPDGLFYDDAWQALGAIKGSLSNLITVGQTQPGFTFGLTVWTHIFGSSTASLLAPALIAGSLGPPVLYLALRRFGFARSISLLLGAMLASARTHITYSTRVKTYTCDVLIVLLLALVVQRLARRRWTRSIAIAWCLASVLVGAFSSIALVGAGAAGAILVLHPKGDLRTRLVSVGAEAVGLGAIFAATSRTYNAQLIRVFFNDRGGFVSYNSDPLHFVREIFTGFWNVARVFPGGRPSVAILAALVGLAIAAWRGPLAIPARFLALMFVIALIGGMSHQIPFGPPIQLGRVSLWLIPAMALGIATVLELARRLIAGRQAFRMGFDAIAVITSVLILLSATGAKYRYPAGARGATREVMAQLGAHDAVLVTRPTTYSFALYAHTPVSLQQTPNRAIGFLPVFTDARIHSHDFLTTQKEFDGFVATADRVFVVHADVDPAGYGKYLFNIAIALTLRGFHRETETQVNTSHFDVWLRNNP